MPPVSMVRWDEVLKLAKGAMALGVLLIATAAVLFTVELVVETEEVTPWALALGAYGATLTAAGVTVVLRWQSRTLTAIKKAAGLTVSSDSDSSVDQEDLAEVVRVIDSRIVGFLEMLADEQQHPS